MSHDPWAERKLSTQTKRTSVPLVTTVLSEQIMYTMYCTLYSVHCNDNLRDFHFKMRIYSETGSLGCEVNNYSQIPEMAGRGQEIELF